MILQEKILLENKCSQIYQIRLIDTQTSYKSKKKGVICQICTYLQTFYPNLPIFFHGHICHIRDILQLWVQQTWEV